LLKGLNDVSNEKNEPVVIEDGPPLIDIPLVAFSQSVIGVTNNRRVNAQDIPDHRESEDGLVIPVQSGACPMRKLSHCY
jgi:hypothetical protein